MTEKIEPIIEMVVLNATGGVSSATIKYSDIVFYPKVLGDVWRIITNLNLFVMKYRRQRKGAGKTDTSYLGLTNIMVFLLRINRYNCIHCRR